MASVGKASLTIVPKFDNLGKSITGALDKVDTTPSGAKMGKGLSDGVARGAGGLVKSGALIGVFSAATTKAMDVISSSVGGAVSRLDTLNNYPRVMQALGYSAEESQASISRMSEHLTGLPTALNDMTSTVQGISAIAGDLGKATDAGLALNDMLLASGSSTQLAGAAMEQFRQMLAKGKPEMEDWKSLTSAMPGQMAQLAKSMLGPTATANDLYAALGGGKNEAILSMDDLMAAMIRLDSEGGDGITSFAEQARNATGGIESSMANMQTAVSRGMAGVLDAVGTDTISGIAKDVGGAFEGTLKAVGEGIVKFKPLANELYEDAARAGESAASLAGKVGKGFVEAEPMISGYVSHLKGVAPTAIAAAASFAAFRGAGNHLADFASRAKESVKQETMLGSANKLLGTSFSPLSVGIAGASAVLGVAVAGYLDAKKKSDDFAKATTGLSDAVSRASALDEYAGKVEGIGEKSGLTAMRVDELRESMAKHVDKINETNEQAEAQIAQLNTAQGIIEAYTGKTDLSTDAQGRLEWALKLVNDQFGLTLTAADVAAGAYTDAEENTVNLKDRIYELIEAKKREIEITALSADLTEATAAQKEAADSYAVARRTYDERLDYYRNYYRNIRKLRGEEAESAAVEAAERETHLSELKGHYEDATKAVDDLYDSMGDAAHAASENADEFDRWGNTLGPLFGSVLADGHTTLAGLKDDMRSLGADTEKLGTLSEDELLRIADAYDGTASSIVGVLGELGVGMDENAAETARAADSVKSALSSMGDGVKSAADGIGHDIGTLAAELSNAGVSADELSMVSSEDFAAMLSSCGGDIATLTGMIGVYNETPVVDKEGNVNVEDASLMDAQGSVYTWNGTEFVDKDGTAVVDDTSLIDSQGNLFLWNGSSLIDQYGNAFVQDGVPAAQQHLERWNGSNLDDQTGSGTISGNMEYANGQKNAWNQNGLASWVGEGIINITKSVTEFFTGGSGNAAGGIRLNAAGGYRFHGAGAIATKAVPLDIVGEDGAEAIVPLTNKRYSLPFAKILAEQIRSVDDGPRGGWDGGARKVEQTFVFNQPVRSPDEVARLIRMNERYGIAAEI